MRSSTFCWETFFFYFNQNFTAFLLMYGGNCIYICFQTCGCALPYLSTGRRCNACSEAAVMVVRRGEALLIGWVANRFNSSTDVYPSNSVKAEHHFSVLTKTHNLTQVWHLWHVTWFTLKAVVFKSRKKASLVQPTHTHFASKNLSFWIKDFAVGHPDGLNAGRKKEHHKFLFLNVAPINTSDLTFHLHFVPFTLL